MLSGVHMNSKKRPNILTDIEKKRLLELQFLFGVERTLVSNKNPIYTIAYLESVANLAGMPLTIIHKAINDINAHAYRVPTKLELYYLLSRAGTSKQVIAATVGRDRHNLSKFERDVEHYGLSYDMLIPQYTDEQREHIKAYIKLMNTSHFSTEGVEL